jgi:LuxR family maltose regulon positive regulatory protein
VLAPLQASGPRLPDVVVPRLCEAIRRRERPFVLVLDDVHCLRNPESLQPLGAIAESIPIGSKLAIASRDEPAIPLGRLRTHRLLTELHAENLAMTTPEASRLLENAGLALVPRSVERLVERTEGWPAGLYLAALALAGEEDADDAVDRFYGDDRFVADYLQDEFLSGLSETDLDFLAQTSILDQLSGSACDAILEREGSAGVLMRLARSNLLLIPLDHHDTTYRYHALLREMLESQLHRLDESKETELHARASRWYAGAGEIDRAVPHAIAAHDLQFAADLIWAATPEYASTARETTLRGWLDRFSQDQLAASPPLCLALATTYMQLGDGREVEHWIATAGEALKGSDRSDAAALEVAVTLLRTGGADATGISEMRRDMEAVLPLLPDDSPWRAFCRFMHGSFFYVSGDRAAARAPLEEGVRRGAAVSPQAETVCLAQLSLLALDEKDPEGAEALIDDAMETVQLFGLNQTPASVIILSVAALVRAERGRAMDAAADLKVAEALLEKTHDLPPWYEAEARIVLARALLLLEDVAGARARLGEAGRYLRRVPEATVLREWLTEAWKEADAAKFVTSRWPLSPAELRLLHFLPTHMSFPQIAEELFLSPNTVKSHARSIYEKLGVSSRAEAVECARKAGLLGADETVPRPASG